MDEHSDSPLGGLRHEAERQFAERQRKLARVKGFQRRSALVESRWVSALASQRAPFPERSGGT